MTPVHIATKPYIKAWIETHLPGGIVDRNHFVGAFVMNMLKRDTDLHSGKVVTYTDRVTIHIATRERKEQGAWLNVTETMQFNNMIGELIRKEVRTHLLTYLHFDPRLKKAVDYARTQTGMSYEHMNDDAIIKDYQRHRAKHGGIRIYNKNKAIA